MHGLIALDGLRFLDFGWLGSIVFMLLLIVGIVLLVRAQLQFYKAHDQAKGTRWSDIPWKSMPLKDFNSMDRANRTRQEDPAVESARKEVKRKTILFFLLMGAGFVAFIISAQFRV